MWPWYSWPYPIIPPPPPPPPPPPDTTWWRHQMETFSALLAICAGNSPVPGEFPTQRPVTQSFDIFFDLRLNNGWVNNREVGDLRRYRTHYDVAVTVRHQANSKHHVDSTMTYIGTSSLRLKKNRTKKHRKCVIFLTRSLKIIFILPLVRDHFASQTTLEGVFFSQMFQVTGIIYQDQQWIQNPEVFLWLTASYLASWYPGISNGLHPGIEDQVNDSMKFASSGYITITS